MADIDSADAIQEIIERQQSLTTFHEQVVQGLVDTWAAMREVDREKLKTIINWKEGRDYIVDPLASKISEAFSDLLFGEDPVFTAAATKIKLDKVAQAAKQGSSSDSEGDGADAADGKANGKVEDSPGPDVAAGDKEPDSEDQDFLDNIIEENDLPSELRNAAEISSSEGEVWWRVYVDRTQSDYPIIEWHSRSHVRPYFRGRKLMAAAFVSELYREEFDKQWVVYRYAEIHSEGYVRCLLYKGTATELGHVVDLSDRPETRDIEEEWEHDLGMLAGRVPNKLGRDKRYGISDYHRVKDLLMSLNEATTIGHENARLTLKRRVVVPREALQKDGTFDASEDVLVADAEELDSTLDQKSGGGKYAVLEYSFDAQALIMYKEDLASIILTRSGIAEQFVNANVRSEGLATSGTALRVRLIPTTLAAKGKARYWDDALPKILMLAQLIDNMEESQGGFGRAWKTPGEPPSVERSEPLPQDETEEVDRHATAVTAEIESRRTAIKAMHKDWTDEQVDDELKEIEKELKEFGGPPKAAPVDAGAAAGDVAPVGV